MAASPRRKRVASGLLLKRLLALPVAEVLAVVEAMNWEDGGLVGDEEKAWPGGCVMTRLAASECGFWKDCHIPACPRARACRGRLTAAQMQPGARYPRYFPPCTRADEDRRQAILRMMATMSGPTTRRSSGIWNDAFRRRHGASRNSGRGSAPFLAGSACWPHRNADVEGGRPGEPERPGVRR